jgi:hypothetical protein
MKLLHDEKGESTVLTLLFLVVIGVMSLHAVTVFSHHVALRSHLSRLAEEIAGNVVTAGMCATAAQAGRSEVDQGAAGRIAREIVEREGATGAAFEVRLNQGGGLVTVVVHHGGIPGVGLAATLPVR